MVKGNKSIEDAHMHLPLIFRSGLSRSNPHARPPAHTRLPYLGSELLACEIRAQRLFPLELYYCPVLTLGAVPCLRHDHDGRVPEDRTQGHQPPDQARPYWYHTL